MSDALPDLGAIIYIAIKPLIKFLIPVSFGFFLCKNDMFPLAASRGAGQLILNVLLPALLFSKIVSAINTENVSAFGPLILIGILYELLGICIGWLVRLSFPVPRNFRNGVLVASMLGNWGDLPFAILQTVTSSAPFDASTDPTLAQAYACVFAVIFITTTFPLRGIALIARDYNEPFDGRSTHPPLARWMRERFGGTNEKNGKTAQAASQPITSSPSADIEEKNLSFEPGTPAASDGPAALLTFPPLTSQRTNQTTRSHHSSIVLNASADAGAVPYSLIRRITPRIVPETVEEPTRPSTPVLSETPSRQPSGQPRRSRMQRWLAILGVEAYTSLRAMLNPPTIALAVSLVIALIKPVKALFVPIPGYTFHQAPDKLPVLDVFYEIAVFLGNATVPVSLTVLGAALARIKVPRPISQLPLRAMFALALGRLALLPILGIAIVQGLTYHTSLVPPSNHVLRFCMMILSCTPSATNQLVLTVVVAPPDVESNSDIFGCFLIVQYMVLVLALTIVTAYSLSLVFT